MCLVVFIVYWVIEGLYYISVYLFISSVFGIIVLRLSMFKVLLIVLSIILYVRENRLSFICLGLIIVCVYMFYYSVLSCYLLNELFNILLYMVITVI